MLAAEGSRVAGSEGTGLAGNSRSVGMGHARGNRPPEMCGPMTQETKRRREKNVFSAELWYDTRPPNLCRENLHGVS